MLVVLEPCYARVRRLILVIADSYYFCVNYIKLVLLAKYLSHLILAMSPGALLDSRSKEKSASLH